MYQTYRCAGHSSHAQPRRSLSRCSPKKTPGLGLSASTVQKRSAFMESYRSHDYEPVVHFNWYMWAETRKETKNKGTKG